MGVPVVKCTDISVNIGKKLILDKVNIEFNSHEFTVLLGPNGTGKSTLLKTLTNEVPYTGSHLLFGKSMGDWDKKTLAKQFGILPQSSSLTFNFTAQEVVELGGLTLPGGQKQIALIAKKRMQQTGVLHLADRLYPSLSGGEKQRVHFARVLTQISSSQSNSSQSSSAQNNKVLFLDEPTSALDLSHQHNTLNLAKEQAEQGACVVAVLHDLNLAAQYADRVVVLNKGNIVADGTPWEVLTSETIKDVYCWSTQILSHPTHQHPVVLSAH
ncbi:heme ABC transporter ATP-binding protein [Vibrio sp. UCD-FRSSP16_10]|uniref:heme ABC transporter ATP-binding protein n=1 Tax=unclassified Vibrio TaxID=2614977 RepID=UPI00080238F6|nr:MULTISPECIES: heme ABC transporter ATP-binding protein [unclassified Vibrio]OBT15514.1 heme ABC transporter ATP-binding protein [Vibrio sp. UCD-FRSSP16_30]OBT20587.1 heme ABC transporter ATP-binding protein [Vibrio sp. UCD-FRSSP16_10]